MQVGEYGDGPERVSRTRIAAPAIDDTGAMKAGRAAIPRSLRDEALVLKSLGLAKPLIARMGARALLNGTSIERELLADGSIEEAAYYEALARRVGLTFLNAIPEEQVFDYRHLDAQLTRPTSIRLHAPGQPPMTVIAPEAGHVGQLIERLERMPGLRRSLAIAPPSLIRDAAWKVGAERRVRATVGALFEDQPQHSARLVVTGRQGFWGGILLSAGVALLLGSPFVSAVALHLALSLLYCASLTIRLGALLHGNRKRRRRRRRLPMPMTTEAELPVYTVMVALYREAGIVRQLVDALQRLDWPRTRLDIMLVCEADDSETLDALRALKLGRQFSIVEVPPMQPRTKPKALSYALNGARGDYVVIYDAEDRPDPGQLREAYERFRRVRPDVACLQAPLVIANARESWISGLFSLEYAALFRRLLPILARYRLPLPLGGTSNHFRIKALRHVGAWDPYNVTEDADLGIRLHRCGYRSATIDKPTFEDAPVTASVWIGQRTRWYKGWLQTWLVVMRRPRRAVADMGLGSFVTFQLLIGGMLISALAHPLIVVFLTSSAFAMLNPPSAAMDPLARLLFAIDLFNVFGTYAVVIALGANALTSAERKALGRRWLAVPLYWMMTSFSAWRAVIELRARPFFWEKTPHTPRAELTAEQSSSTSGNRPDHGTAPPGIPT